MADFGWAGPGSTPAAVNDDPTFEPKEVVDLGALVTEDLPQRVWGAGYLEVRGFGPGNSFDVRDYPAGRSVPKEVFSGSVEPEEVVLIFTGYAPPGADNEVPEVVTLTPAAAEYLANLPVRAFGTDAWSVHSPQDDGLGEAEAGTAAAAPIHHAFLSRGIPVYEQLFSVDRLLNRSDSESMHFVGVPLNIKDGDGMIVRPVVFFY